MPTLDAQTLWLLGAGMIGRALHVIVTFNAQPWTRQRAVETFLGGFAGVLCPSVPGFSDLTPWSQVVAAVIATYFAADVLVNIVRRMVAAWKSPTP